MNRYKYIDTDKAHLHTLDGKPLFGTSTVTHIIAKPLTWWASGMAVERFGWLNPKKFSKEECYNAAADVKARVNEMTVVEYMALLKAAYYAHNEKKEKAADAGTDRHAALERYVKMTITDHGGKPIRLDSYEDPAVESLVEWAQTQVKRFLWSEINGYSEVMWTGGIADVGWEDFQSRIIAGDFKSGGPYFDQFVQVAGYDMMLTENGGLTADGEKVFEMPGEVQGYCVLPFGPDKFEPKFEYNVQMYRNSFRSAVQMSKAQKDYEGRCNKRGW